MAHSVTTEHSPIRGRLDALFATVEAVMAVILMPAGQASSASEQRRDLATCARALGQLAWLTEQVRAVKFTLETREASVSPDVEVSSPTWAERSHSISIH